MIDRTPEAECAALEDLLRSEGWELYVAQMKAAWGPEAYERRLDDALDGNVAPTDELAITRRIRDTFKGVRATLAWPEERVRALKDGQRTVTAKAGDAFQQFRRVRA